MRAVLAAVLLPFLIACGSNDRESCIAEAATKPTDVGVRVAVAQCNRKFPEYQRQSDEIDKFLGTKPGGMFDDLIPAHRPRPDFMQQMLPVTSIILVLVLGAAGLVPVPIVARLWLLRAARLVCWVSVATQAVWLYLGRSSLLPPAVLWLSIGILGALYFALWWLINWVHKRKFGVAHPTFESNPWAL